MAKVKVKVTKDNTKKFLKQLGDLVEIHAVVGVLQGEANDDHGGGTSVLDVALFNEYGTEDIPARSFLRDTYELREKKIGKTVRSLILKEAKGNINKSRMISAMKKAGAYVLAEVLKRISTRIPPPNDPATIAKKGSDVPLIDTGLLRKSLTFEVRDTIKGRSKGSGV